MQKQTIFMLDESTKLEAQQRALANGMSLTAVLRGLVAAWLRGDISLEVLNEQALVEPGTYDA